LFCRLPDKEEEMPIRYDRRSGTSVIDVHTYCALAFLRATNKGYRFKLGSNLEGYGVFGDVVVRVEYLDGNCRKSHIFLQLKSRAVQHITLSKLKSKNGDFSLRKCYDSYIEVQETLNCGEERGKLDGKTDESEERGKLDGKTVEILFIIYTNIDVATDLTSDQVTHFGEEDFLKTGGFVLQFNKDEHKAIYKHLQELPKHEEFLSRFRIFYKQADEKEMYSLIKHELQQSMKLPESELDLAYVCYRDVIKDWWQNCNYFLQDTNSMENDPIRKTADKVRIKKILDQRKSELDNLSIQYKQSVITDMKKITKPHKAVLIFAPGRLTTLTAAKIHQMLRATEHMIINLQQLVHYKTEVMLAWKNQFDVLVLESQSSNENFQEVLKEISMILNESGEKKRLIFIANRMGNTKQLNALRQTFSTNLREEYEDWKFSDIVTESKQFLLEKEVNFQGAKIQIKDLVKESDFRMLNALDCDSISPLLANEKPSIGTPIENTLQCYTDRSLECIANFKGGNQAESETLVQFRQESLEELQGTSSYRGGKCNVSDRGLEVPHLSFQNGREKEKSTEYGETKTMKISYKKDQKLLIREITDAISNVQLGFQSKSTQVWPHSTLLDGEDGIILVTDDPGMEKSTILTNLAKQTREIYPNIWIVMVNIKNYTNILDAIKTKGFEEEGAIKMLTEAAQIKQTEGSLLEKQLFNYIYNSTGNMAVLFFNDTAATEIYTEEVTQILRILSETKIRKVWVTSCNSVKDKLEQEFQCQSYSLLTFSVEDQ
jgi:hypothetical protein